jgi:hypothetical protein
MRTTTQHCWFERTLDGIPTRGSQRKILVLQCKALSSATTLHPVVAVWDPLSNGPLATNVPWRDGGGRFWRERRRVPTFAGG